MQNKSIYSLIAGILGLIGFFFGFLSIGYYGFGYSINGFTFAFAFDGSSFLVLLSLLAAIAGVILLFLKMDLYSAICFFAAAVLVLLFAITYPAGGFGIWWCLIFFAAAGALNLFGDRFPLPAIGVNIPTTDANKVKEKVANVGASFKQSQAQNQGGSQPGAFCTSCGAKIGKDDAFCPSCGAKR